MTAASRSDGELDAIVSFPSDSICRGDTITRAEWMRRWERKHGTTPAPAVECICGDCDEVGQ